MLAVTAHLVGSVDRGRWGGSAWRPGWRSQTGSRRQLVGGEGAAEAPPCPRGRRRGVVFQSRERRLPVGKGEGRLPS